MCPYCLTYKESRGEIKLTFRSGRTWILPGLALHYIADHGWLPPRDFMHDVMHSEIAAVAEMKILLIPIRIGNLGNSFRVGDTPPGFLEKLESMASEAYQEEFCSS